MNTFTSPAFDVGIVLAKSPGPSAIQQYLTVTARLPVLTLRQLGQITEVRMVTDPVHHLAVIQLARELR